MIFYRFLSEIDKNPIGQSPAEERVMNSIPVKCENQVITTNNKYGVDVVAANCPEEVSRNQLELR